MRNIENASVLELWLRLDVSSIVPVAGAKSVLSESTFLAVRAVYHLGCFAFEVAYGWEGGCDASKMQLGWFASARLALLHMFEVAL